MTPKFNDMSRRQIPVAQLIAQQEHAARVWEELHPGRPMHFEVDATRVEEFQKADARLTFHAGESEEL